MISWQTSEHEPSEPLDFVCVCFFFLVFRLRSFYALLACLLLLFLWGREQASTRVCATQEWNCGWERRPNAAFSPAVGQHDTLTLTNMCQEGP